MQEYDQKIMHGGPIGEKQLKRGMKIIFHTPFGQ